MMFQVVVASQIDSHSVALVGIAQNNTVVVTIEYMSLPGWCSAFECPFVDCVGFHHWC